MVVIPRSCLNSSYESDYLWFDSTIIYIKFCGCPIWGPDWGRSRPKGDDGLSWYRRGELAAALQWCSILVPPYVTSHQVDRERLWVRLLGRGIPTKIGTFCWKWRSSLIIISCRTLFIKMLVEINAIESNVLSLLVHEVNSTSVIRNVKCYERP